MGQGADLAPVVLLTGAGSSKPFAYPTTPEFLALFSKDYGSDLFRIILSTGKFSDIEDVLVLLDDILAFSQDERRYAFMVQFSGAPQWQALITKCTELKQAIIASLFRYYEFKEETKQKSRKVLEPLFQDIVSLNDSLGGKKQVVLFTLNYDRVFEKFCDKNPIYHCLDGFRQETNSPEWVWDEPLLDVETGYTSALLKLYKLHGSLSWRRVRNDGLRKLDTDEMTEKSKIFEENVLLYPGKVKLGEREPYGSLFKRFTKYMQNALLCILVGYSFRDEEVNLKIRDFLSNPFRTLIVVSPTANEHMSKFGRKYMKELHVFEKSSNGSLTISLGNSSLIIPIPLPYEAETVIPIIREKIQASGFWVIDFSDPPGSLSGNRVIITNWKAYHMGPPYDEWVREKMVPVIRGTGNWREFLRERRIEDTGGPPRSVEWLESRWKEARTIDSE